MDHLIQLLGGRYRITAYAGLTGSTYNLLDVQGYIKNVSWHYRYVNFKESKFKKKEPK